MPKGVEHIAYANRTALRGMVVLSLMPKGVEHIAYANRTALRGMVVLSLMPKGVEHFSLSDIDVATLAWFFR